MKNEKQDLNTGNIPVKLNETIFEELFKKCETMDNYTFLQTMKQASGYLTNEQRLKIINKYVKIDGDLQIKYYEQNKKQREKFYDEHIKAKIDPNLPLTSDYNLKKTQLPAQEEILLNDLEKSFRSAKQLAENIETRIKEDDRTNSKFGNRVNAKTKNVIVEYKNGEIEYCNRKDEQDKMSIYKKQFNTQQNFIDKIVDKEYNIEQDSEWE